MSDNFLLFIISIIFLFISFFFTFLNINNFEKLSFLKLDNKLLKSNLDECYKYIEHLEEEKRRNHYD